MIPFQLESAGGAGSSNFSVSVIGIGGAGANVLDRIALDGMAGAELISLNCDVRALTTSMASRKVQLGRSLTQGLGCGGDPELGMEATLASAQEIREMIAGRHMVFVCVGLGGGTGSGAAPLVARLAREAGAFVVVFATLPFVFEGKRRMSQAITALHELRLHANALVTFENDRMGELILPKKGITEAFEMADRIIGQSIRAVTSLVTQPGLIRIGMDDLITALRNADSRCLFGFGQAKGENRAVEALNLALKSPLLDRGQMLEHARNVLVHVCGGNSVTLFEIELLMRELSKHVSDEAQILFGAASDPKLNDHLSVTILTSLAKVAPAPAAGAEQAGEKPAAPPSAPAQRPHPIPVLPVPPKTIAPTQGTATAPTGFTMSSTAAPVLQLDATPSLLTIPVPTATAHAAETTPAAIRPHPVAEPEFGSFTDDEPSMQESETDDVPAPRDAVEDDNEPAWDETEEAVVSLEPAIESTTLDEEALTPLEALPDELEPAPAPALRHRLRPLTKERTEAAPQPRPAPAKKFDLREILNQQRKAKAPMYGYQRNGNGRPDGLEDIEAIDDADPPVTAPPPAVKGPPAPAKAATRPAPAPAPAPESVPDPARITPIRPIPARQTSPFIPTKPPAEPMPATGARQQTFDERLAPARAGRFENTEPTVEEGEDLDVPTFLRKKR